MQITHHLCYDCADMKCKAQLDNLHQIASEDDQLEWGVTSDLPKCSWEWLNKLTHLEILRNPWLGNFVASLDSWVSSEII